MSDSTSTIKTEFKEIGAGYSKPKITLVGRSYTETPQISVPSTAVTSIVFGSSTVEDQMDFHPDF